MQKMKKNDKSLKPSKKSKTEFNPSPEMLVHLLESGQKPLRLDQILRFLDIQRRQKGHVEAMLQQLTDEGRIVRMHGGQWVARGQMRTFVGYYSVQRSGVGFVDMARPDYSQAQSDTQNETHKQDAEQESLNPITEQSKKKTSDKDSGFSIFIHPSQAGDAWHGDTVRVILLPGRGSKEKPEGRIIEVVQRKATDVMVRISDMREAHNPHSALQKRGKKKRLGTHASPDTPYLFCKPCDVRFPFTIRLTKADIKPEIVSELSHNTLVLVRPTQQLASDLWQGEALSTHGREDNVAVQENLVKLNHGAPAEFPPAALAEAEALPEAPRPEDFAERQDVRHLPFVTIDGETARDFDDAIYVKKQDNGGYILYVGIADVTHYVHPGSALDKEARIRGNSWYFPRSVEPMLPKALSNGLCSLNPKVNRLIMLAEMHFDKAGALHKSHFSEAVMLSHARLTYTEVKALVIDKDSAAREEFLRAEHGTTLLAMLEDAETFARILAQKRMLRGTLDFHMPEPEYHFDEQGRIVDISRKEQHFAHQLIEEFMIAANEAVAEFLEEKGAPVLYRVHPEPESLRLEGLFRTLASTALAEKIPAKPSAKDIQGILTAAKDSPQEFLVGRLALRTMPQARYQPENDGHFGLASTCYCHFTSPIRRYADVVVHRALKEALAIDNKAFPAHKLVAIGDGLNQCERAAMEAEREMARRLAVMVLHGHEGQKYQGTIAGVSDFGLFVELDAMPVEGMIRIAELGDDYFEYDTDKQELIGVMSGTRFALGQRVWVRLAEVNLGRLEITLSLLEAETLPPAQGRGKKGRAYAASSKQGHKGKSSRTKSGSRAGASKTGSRAGGSKSGGQKRKEPSYLRKKKR